MNSTSYTSGPLSFSSTALPKEVFDVLEPTQKEIVDYARKIGINPEKEPHLLPIARDGLLQTLPYDWQPCYNKQRKAYYYFNVITKTTQWEHPLDVIYKGLVEKARRQGLTDLSEDSGIRSLQENEEPVKPKEEPVVEVPPETMERHLAPLSKRPMWELQPLPKRPLTTGQQIGLEMPKTKPDPVKPITAEKPPVKGFTLTGTGAIFLKSKKVEGSDSSVTKPIDIEKTKPNFLDQHVPTTSTSVKGILRDSSLSDVRRPQGQDISHQSEISDRKSVKFNLTETAAPRQLPEVSTSGSSTSSSEDLAAGEAEEDNWDFNMSDEGDDDGVRQVTVQPVNRVTVMKPSQKTPSDEVQSRPSSSRPPSLARAFSIAVPDDAKDKAGPSVKPLYEESDSESAANSVKNSNFPPPLNVEPDPLMMQEDRRLIVDQMIEDLDKFRSHIEQEKRLEEEKIRREMKMELEAMRKEIAEKNQSELNLFELESTKVSNRKELEDLIAQENRRFASEKEETIRKLKKNHEDRLEQLIHEQEAQFEEMLKKKRRDLEENHRERMTRVENDMDSQLKHLREEIEATHRNALEEFREKLKNEFEERRKIISADHKASVETLQKNHSEILQELERDLKTEEELLKKEHTMNLNQAKAKISHEIEMEKQRMRESGEDRLYEKIRCEKRLLEDKYRCLKEKYTRLKTDVKLSLERRNNRRREQQQQSVTTTTGSETERSISNRQHMGLVDVSPVGRPPTAPLTPKSQPKFRDSSTETREKSLERHLSVKESKKFGAATKYLKHIQQQNDDTTSISQSDTTVSNPHGRLRIPVPLGDNGNSDSEAINRNNNNQKDGTPLRQRKKLFTRTKSASTSRLNTSKGGGDCGRPCTPVENLRRQLQKLEDLEDQFPDSSLDTTYHLRYPFSDVANNYASMSSELEFFKHRIHLERDSVRRAKDSLRTQRTNFRARQREIKLRHKSGTKHTIDHLIQEEKELTEMEVNLHRTRALLGEKVIRLRHLEQSLQRVCEKEKPILMERQHHNPRDDATLSDVSSSHSSSGFSSTDFITDTNHHGGRQQRELYQESSDIIQSLEHLNAEIKEIWEILSKQQAHGIPPPPINSYGQDGSWNNSPTSAQMMFSIPVTQSTSASGLQQPTKPTDRLDTYKQPPIVRAATTATPSASATVHTIVSQSPLAGHYTTSLVERTRNLKIWLNQAKSEHEMLAGKASADL
ncbi:centrosomal protein of 164 kDa isoform X2 [Phlebotomus papatasi]|uniref:centrosomal protein of 164 kDa isoform X2 n=1 Tax=Phlebotomus papatasi TaxID=29031 RepID=UPI0024836389|nr:centrosomal protein of 164 kDa isoform X2 [Phlebotomus papatasi]